MTKNIIISMMACLILSITACQKDDNKITKSSQISQEDLDMSKKITAFIDKMNNPSTLKSGELINVDDALWSLEAAMNYSFADIPERFTDTKVDTLTFTLSIENGFCQETDLSALYQSVDAAIQAYCNTLGEYQLLGVDFNMSEEATGAMTVYLISGKGTSSYSMFVFGPTDYWKAGYGLGKCGDYEGQCLGRDATTEIISKANASNPRIAILNGAVYYTDIDPYTLSGCDYYNPDFKPGDDPLKRCLFYCTLSVETLPYGTRCLDPDILNFYLANLKHYANNVWKPAGKDLISYLRWELDHYLSIDDDKSYYADEYHFGVLRYGIRHIRPAIIQDH